MGRILSGGQVVGKYVETGKSGQHQQAIAWENCTLSIATWQKRATFFEGRQLLANPRRRT